MTHAPGAGLIAQAIDLQPNAPPLCYGWTLNTTSREVCVTEMTVWNALNLYDSESVLEITQSSLTFDISYNYHISLLFIWSIWSRTETIRDLDQIISSSLHPVLLLLFSNQFTSSHNNCGACFGWRVFWQNQWDGERLHLEKLLRNSKQQKRFEGIEFGIALFVSV